MNETVMGGKTTSMFGNSYDARGMYQRFNGELMPLQILGIGNPRAIIDALANAQWREMAAGILPPEVMKMIEPFIHGLTAQMEKFLDAASEKQHAVELRNAFGEPQSELAFPVFHSLTVMAEQSHETALTEANQAEKILEWLRASMRETFLVWHLTEVAKHEAQLKQLDETQTAITEQKAQTKFATAEAGSMTKFLIEKKEKIQQGLALAEAKLLAFTTKIFGGDLAAAEAITVSAQSNFSVAELDPAKAIPVTPADLAYTT